jgi:hypothetical protein
MYYDKLGRLRAAGAEAESSSVLTQAEDEGWIKEELYVSSLFFTFSAFHPGEIKIQITSPAQNNETTNERNAPEPTSFQENCYGCFWRFSIV